MWLQVSLEHHTMAIAVSTLVHPKLLKAAKTTGAWVLTGGLSIGVTRHVGDALVTERSPRLRSGRVVSIGIAPWGIVDNRQTLVQQNKDVPYHSLANPASKFSPLNQLHSQSSYLQTAGHLHYHITMSLPIKAELYVFASFNLCSLKAPFGCCSGD